MQSDWAHVCRVISKRGLVSFNLTVACVLFQLTLWLVLLTTALKVILHAFILAREMTEKPGIFYLTISGGHTLTNIFKIDHVFTEDTRNCKQDIKNLILSANEWTLSTGAFNFNGLFHLRTLDSSISITKPTTMGNGYLFIIDWMATKASIDRATFTITSGSTISTVGIYTNGVIMTDWTWVTWGKKFTASSTSVTINIRSATPNQVYGPRFGNKIRLVKLELETDYGRTHFECPPMPPASAAIEPPFVSSDYIGCIAFSEPSSNGVNGLVASGGFDSKNGFTSLKYDFLTLDSYGGSRRNIKGLMTVQKCLSSCKSSGHMYAALGGRGSW
jgi:hypothetical protein